MENKRKIILGISAAIIAVLTVVTIIFIGGYFKNNDIRKNAKSTIDCMIKSDFSENFYYISTYGEVESELGPLSELSMLTMRKMKYKLGKITVDEEKGFATIEAEFECVDMQNLIEQVSEYNNYREKAIEKIKTNEYETKEFDITIIMLKNDGVWYLYETTELDDALTGGLYSLNSEIEDAFIKDAVEGEN